MKRLLVLGTIILFALSVHAQTGMPQELTCTERAFNFSFGLGSGWKLTAPKMGPVEVQNEGLGYGPTWLLKPGTDTTQTYLLPISTKPIAARRYQGSSLLYESQFLLPKLKLTALPDYTKPNPASW
jgi:hypothetical protein